MYKTINGWTKAKMIERVLKKNNGTQCVDEIDDCQYRGDNGNQCLIGAFIPDESYVAGMEGDSIRGLLLGFPLLRQHMPMEERGLSNFQQVHDHPDSDDIHEVAIEWIENNVEDSDE